MSRQPQRLSGEVTPPGYDYDTARKRFQEHEEGASWSGPGKAPNSGKTLFVRRGEDWERRRATYFHDGVFVMWGSFEQEAPPDDPDEIVKRTTYYREKINTPVAQGEEVTRYIVGAEELRSPLVTSREDVAREEVEKNDLDWEDDVRTTEGVRLLGASGGRYGGWAFWSDHLITPGMDRDEIGDMTAEGNGTLSTDAEALIRKVWKGGSSSIEHFDNGKKRLREVEEITDREPVEEKIVEREGWSRYNYHDTTGSLERLTAETTGGGRDKFYLLSMVYSGMAPDGYVDENYYYFDEIGPALEKYHSLYGVRRSKKKRVLRGRQAFEEKHGPKVKYYDENGAEVEGLVAAIREEVVDEETVWPEAPAPTIVTAEEKVLFGINHYLPTGPEVGDGTTWTIGDKSYVLIAATERERDQDSWSALKRRIEELKAECEIDWEVDTDSNRGRETTWITLEIKTQDAEQVGEALAERSSPIGWGWTYEWLVGHGIIEEKPEREEAQEGASGSQSGKKQLWIGMDEGTAVSSERTRRQVEAAKKRALAVTTEEGDEVTWEDLDDREEPRSIFQALTSDREKRIDEGTAMANRPPFAILTMGSEERITRVEYYEGHNRLSLSVDLRHPDLWDENLGPSYSE